MDLSPDYYRNISPIYKKIIQIVLFVVELFLGFRFIIRFMGLDPDSTLVDIVYKTSQPFAFPFIRALGSFTEERSIFEWPTLIAMVVYWFIAWIIIKIFLADRSTLASETEKKFQ